MKYLISANFTIEAENEDSAKSNLQQFLTAALVGERSEVEDYSVEDTLEIWTDDGAIHLGKDK